MAQWSPMFSAILHNLSLSHSPIMENVTLYLHEGECWLLVDAKQLKTSVSRYSVFVQWWIKHHERCWDICGPKLFVSHWSYLLHWAFVFCFVSTLVKLTTNDNVVKMVTAHCCLANVQLFCSAAVTTAKQKNVDAICINQEMHRFASKTRFILRGFSVICFVGVFWQQLLGPKCI